MFPPNAKATGKECEEAADVGGRGIRKTAMPTPAGTTARQKSTKLPLANALHPHANQDLLTDLLLTGPLKDSDALLLDLRDGLGGASPTYLKVPPG
jgi:hypothetical protein